jgi:hypothetical protein
MKLAAVLIAAVLLSPAFAEGYASPAPSIEGGYYSVHDKRAGHPKDRRGVQHRKKHLHSLRGNGG